MKAESKNDLSTGVLPEKNDESKNNQGKQRHDAIPLIHL